MHILLPFKILECLVGELIFFYNNTIEKFI